MCVKNAKRRPKIITGIQCSINNFFHFSEKQQTLEAIREKLAAQLKQKLDDEDERIREAVMEAEEKRAREEAEKEGKMKHVIASQAAHRNLQVSQCGVKDCVAWGRIYKKIFCP